MRAILASGFLSLPGHSSYQPTGIGTPQVVNCPVSCAEGKRVLMNRTLAYLPLILVIASALTAQDTPAAAMLEKIRGLDGRWEGTLQWTGGRTSTGSLTATYSQTGMHSAVVETLIMDSVPSMTSVYHLDGADLRMTHFCGAGNQPRLKASSVDLTRGMAEFAFVDITNLKNADAGHVIGARLHILAPDHLQIEFTFTAGGKTAVEHIDLHRVSAQ